MTSPVTLPEDGDPVATAAFVARHAGSVVAYLDEVTTPERALRGAGEAFAALRVRLAATRPDDAAVARTLLAATRTAAGRHAGRGTTSPDAVDDRETAARLLAARYAGRLGADDDTALDALLRTSPSARELAADFARAEQGYARDRRAPLTGTEVGVIATAMALAVVPPAGPGAAGAAAGRRTAIPARPVAAASRPDAAGGEPSGAAAVAPSRGTAGGSRPQRTPVPAAPPAEDPPAEPPAEQRPAVPDAGGMDQTPAGSPTEPAGPLAADTPGGRTPDPTAARTAGAAGTASVGRGPDDPFGPESLGYVVPRPGLPRPERRAAPPRRRRRRTPAAAEIGPDDTADGPKPVAPSDPATATNRGVAKEATPEKDATPAADATRETDAATVTETVPPAQATHASGPQDATSSSPVPRGAAASTLARVSRGVVESPAVRQLGVPALLLLAVLIAALIAAGAFSGERDESVPPVPRPTIPTVPGDPRAIPPLP